MADEYRKQNNKVLSAATTCSGAGTDVSVMQADYRKNGTTGKLYGWEAGRENSDKITTLSEDVLRRAMDHADVTLIEADGSKHLPVKYPGAHEPVIYPYSTKIILVMGLWTLGEPIKKTVFRYEELIKIRMAGRGWLDI